MSERLPYEEYLNQQWTNVPLPDENMAWTDMRRRLEEDDDDGIIVWWRRGCGLWGLLLLLLAGTGWWILRPEKYFKSSSETTNIVTTKKDSSGVNGQPNATVNPGEKNRQENRKPPGDTAAVEIPLLYDNPVAGEIPRQEQIKKIERPRPRRITAKPNPTETAKPEKEDVTTEEKRVTDTSSFTSINPVTETKPVDSAVTEPKKTDSTKKPAPKKPEPADSSKKSKLFFSTGIALQQQLPISGQKATPYNALGRKGSLLDYIPSIYVRLNKKDKWFIQAEFKYGAPQYTKEFTYYQQAISDTGSNPAFVTNTSNRLKKTFYHQLPLTFNYFVKPNWPVGGGLIWNKFYGAVSDREVIKHNNFTNDDSVVFKGIVTDRNDTSNNFEKSYFQAVFETQYQWKRFSIGARYAFGLQPYIRFTLPGQPERKERNSNVNLFLRFELWRKK